MIRRRLLSPLGLRLLAAFVVVAVAAIVISVVLTVTLARTQVAHLVMQTHQEDAQAAAAAAAAAYEGAGGWRGADLSSAVAVAARGQATVIVLDEDGTVVAAPADEAARLLAEMHGVEIADVPRLESVRAPVMVGDIQVGTVDLKYPSSHLPSSEQQIRDALSETGVIGAIVAVLAAVGVAIFVAARVSRPINALTTAAAELEAGRRDVRVNLAKAPGEIGSLAAAFDRMSEAVQREDELRRNLVSDMAHELRTPLTILRGTTEALVDEVLTPDVDTLASLHDEVLRLSQLVGDLEVLASAEAASLHLEAGPVDLADVARATLDLARASATAAELELRSELEPAPVMGDDGRLRQVTMNLVANALRYTPAGGTITVRTRVERGQATLTVLDTGPGIHEQDLPRLFERFYRGRVAGDMAGSGIGLAVVKELLAAHGGTIEASNRDEGGAAFTARLPLAPSR